MLNFIENGDKLQLEAPKDVIGGDAVAIGSLVGVAYVDAKEGELTNISLKGVYELPKLTTEAWSAGDKLYLAENGKLVKTAGELPFAGFAFADVVQAEVVGPVKLSN
jgi:predicted RecA/RadA family phage recombinase